MRNTYDDIDVLTPYQFARLRNDVFFGSQEPTEQSVVGFDGHRLAAQDFTFVPALSVYLREIVDNAVDEVAGHGHGDSIWIDYDQADNVYSVEDNGRGIPPELVEKLLANTMSGRNFRQRDAVAGKNGVGASITNYSSEWFAVDSKHDGAHHKQRFSEGDKNLVVSKPTSGRGDHPAGQRYSAGSGTRIRFKPSSKVFSDPRLPEAFVKARVYELAAAYPEVKFHYNGGRIKLAAAMKRSLLAGLDPIEIRCAGKTPVRHTASRELGATEDRVTEHAFESTFYLVPGFGRDKSEVIHSVVNGIPAYQGGTHVQAFRSEFYNGVISALERDAKKRKLELDKVDVSHGLLIYNVTKMASPNFETQSKSRLVSPEAGKAVARALDEDAIKRVVRDNPKWVEAIMKRCAERTHKEDFAEAARESKKALKARVAKLRDANGRDRSKCVLFIAEGDSAIGGMVDVRDPEVHGGLPLRGKIMNVLESSPAEVVQSKELLDVMAAIGLQIGTKAFRSTLRYGAIYIATDEDVDGYNILCLVVNFLHRFWPELFDKDLAPFVFKFDTPYLILEKGKERRYFFGHNVDTFDQEKFSGWSMVRAKGLGRLERQYWADMLSSPSLIPIVDDGHLAASLDLSFNKSRADDRKEWLSRPEAT